LHLIFDFDGTIADSFDYVFDYLSKAAKKTNISAREADTYRGLSMRDIALKLDIPLWRLPFVYFKGRRKMRAHMESVKAFDGMIEVVKRLKKDHNNLYIISSNSRKNIRSFLKRYQINDCFRSVWSGAGILGKIKMIRHLRRRFRIKDDLWYVGDETVDVASAKMAGAKVIAVTWGFASLDALKQLEPDKIVSTPKQLLNIEVTR
jgi:phosphoglycolate phosphatase